MNTWEAGSAFARGLRGLAEGTVLVASLIEPGIRLGMRGWTWRSREEATNKTRDLFSFVIVRWLVAQAAINPWGLRTNFLAAPLSKST